MEKTIHMGFRIPYSVVKERRGHASPGFPDFGGDNRDRTGDLSLAKAALSQLSYIPLLRDMILVGLSGFEPLTSRLSGVRSNQLSYRPRTRSALQQSNNVHEDPDGY